MEDKQFKGSDLERDLIQEIVVYMWQKKLLVAPMLNFLYNDYGFFNNMYSNFINDGEIESVKTAYSDDQYLMVLTTYFFSIGANLVVSQDIKKKSVGDYTQIDWNTITMYFSNIDNYSFFLKTRNIDINSDNKKVFDDLFNYSVNLYKHLTNDECMSLSFLKTLLKVMFNAGFTFGNTYPVSLDKKDDEEPEESNETNEDEYIEEDEPTNVLDEMDPDKLVLIESKQKDALYEGISILKYMFAAKIKDYKVGDLLLYSLMINLCEETHKGYITLDEILKHYNNSINKKVIINGYDYSKLFSDLDYSKLVDAACGVVLLTDLIVLPIYGKPLKGYELLNLLNNQKQSIKETITKAFDDRLYDIDNYRNRFYIHNILDEKIYINAFKDYKNKSLFNDSQLEDYNYSFINFDIDPLGNGFTVSKMADYYYREYTKEKLNNDKNKFLSKLAIEDTEIDEKLADELKTNFDVFLNSDKPKLRMIAEVCLERGTFVDQDLDKAVELLEGFAKKYDASAIYRLAFFNLYGIGNKIDYSDFAERIMLCASLGYDEARYFVEKRYKYEVNRLSKKGENWEDNDTSIFFKSECLRAKKKERSQDDEMDKVVDYKKLYKLFIKKTDKIISPYKKYTDEYDEEVKRILSDKSSDSPASSLLYELLLSLDDKIDAVAAKKIGIYLEQISDKVESAELQRSYNSLLEQGIRMTFNYSNTANNVLSFCWFLYAYDLGYEECFELAVKHMDCLDIDNNIYAKEFKVECLKKKLSYSEFKKSRIRDFETCKELVDMGFGPACCPIIKEYIIKNDLDKANYYYKKLWKLCSSDEISNIRSDFRDWFESDNNTVRFSLYYSLSQPDKYPIIEPYSYERFNEKKKGCYIATCVYGSYDCEQVWRLRRYRDEYLDKHWWGRIFIKIYYKVSPTLVKLFGNTKWFKNIFKKYLDKKEKKLIKKGYESTPYNDKY